MKNEVRQAELAGIYALRVDLERLTAECRKAEVALDEAEAPVLARLLEDAAVEPGELTAEVKWTSRILPCWRKICESRLGLAAVKRIIANTPPTQTPRLAVSLK